MIVLTVTIVIALGLCFYLLLANDARCRDVHALQRRVDALEKRLGGNP